MCSKTWLFTLQVIFYAYYLVEYDWLFTESLTQICPNHPFKYPSHLLQGICFALFSTPELLSNYLFNARVRLLEKDFLWHVLQRWVQLCRHHGLSQDAKYAFQWNKHYELSWCKHVKKPCFWNIMVLRELNSTRLFKNIEQKTI